MSSHLGSLNDRVVDPPIVLYEPQQHQWGDEADVIVVGLGAAGASAAIAARDQGAEVLIVDRFDGGGATRWSGGIYYAGDTAYQREAGKSDSADEMFKYLSLEVDDAVAPETLKRFCDTSNESVEWLNAQGVAFEGSLFAEKTTFPPEDKYLYYSGNEKVPAFAAHAKPAPRGHRVYGVGWTGYVLAGKLKAAAAEGTRRLLHARVTRLIQDQSGVVIGVEVLQLPAALHSAHQALYEKMDPMRPFGFRSSEKLVAEARAMEANHGRRCALRARSGVILACGGFAYNLPMVERHMPQIAATAETLIRMSSLSCDGSGIQLGQSVGALTAKLDTPFLGRLLAPPEAAIDGIIVNQHGQRFINEDTYNCRLGIAILAQPETKAWLVLDNSTYRRVISQALQFGKGTFKNFGLPTILNILFGGTKKARTLAGLERKCGFPAGSLQETVATLNAAKESGLPDPGGKGPDNFARMGAGPYRAINTAVTNRFSFMPFFTLGGLRVDQETGQVLSEQGGSIGGLYAAGRTAVGLCSDGYISGLSLADCVFSGRRAGNSSAQTDVSDNSAARVRV